LVAAGTEVYAVDAAGDVEKLVDGAGTGLYGLAMGPNGLIVAAFGQRQVVEFAPDGTRRVLLTSEPPWGPADLAVADGALYVVELAEHPCCWKGPRVRRLVAGQMPTTLLTIDDGRHLHISPGERPLQWLMGIGALAVVAIAWGVVKVVRHKRRTGIGTRDPA
jgi:hypothetical protein